jgi:4-carboxymuconolactone decarboxylase
MCDKTNIDETAEAAEEIVVEAAVMEERAQAEEVAAAEIEEAATVVDEVGATDGNEAAGPADAADADEAAAETTGPDEEAANDQAQNDADDRQAAWQARHDRRVAGIAARFAALVEKGQKVIASLDARADAADSSFSQKAAAADARINDFAASMQTRMEKATDQFARDLDVIVRAVDNAGGDGTDAASSAESEGFSPVEPDDLTVEPEDTTPYRPQFTPAAQAFRERMKVGAASDLMLTDPEFVERFANFAFDDVAGDVDLPDRTRFMCWLATLLGCQGIDEFRALLPAALNMGVEPETIKEIVYQAAAYLGIGRVYPFLKATNEALVAAGIQLPLKKQATTLPTEESRYEGGEQAQMACFGPQMAGYKDRGNPEYPWINQWLVKNCFGDWYTRGGLTIPEREMVTFCYIAAQGGCEAQLRAHTAGNVQCGNDREFLIKVVSNNVPFIGYPRSLNAMAVVDKVAGK